MLSTRLEAYQDTFGFHPDQLLASFERCTPADWCPITHYQVQQIGAEAVQHAIFYSPYEHCFIPGSHSVITEARAASDYVADQVPDLGKVAINLEGRVRKPPKLSAENFEDFGGELGVFEEGLRAHGIVDELIKSPEPSQVVARSIGEEEGEVSTLAYFILRQLPQIFEKRRSYPYTQLVIVGNELARATGLPPVANLSRMIKRLWNDQHPSELHIVPGREVTPGLIAALRRETTLLPCLKVPPEARTPVQNVAVKFNLERQLGFAATLANDLGKGGHSVFGIGRMHTLALAHWLERRTDSDGYVRLS